MATKTQPHEMQTERAPQIPLQYSEQQQPLRKSRPRLRRDPDNKPSFRLQDKLLNPYAGSDRDFELVKAVWENRFISTQLLLRLLPPDRSKTPLHTFTDKPQHSGTQTIDRLSKLYHHEYLNRHQLNRGGDFVYTLDNKGAWLLKEHDLPISIKIDWREKNRDISEMFVDHTLMIARFYVALVVSLRQHPYLSLVSFEHENEDLKIVFNYRGKRLSVDPDAYFILKDSSAPEGRQYMPFLVEADRSTMDLARMKAKQAKYALMFSEGHYQEKFKIPPAPALGYAVARVLTITKSRERAESLLRLPTRGDIRIDQKSNVPPQYKTPSALLPAFYFTPELSYREHFEDVLAEHWRRADDLQPIRSIIRQPLPRKGDLVFKLDSDRQPKLV